MSYRTSIKKVTILAAGTTLAVSASDPYEEYVLLGSATLVGNVVVSTVGSPPTPVRIRIMYKATLTTSALITVTIFGNVLNNQQALSGNVIVDAIWDGTTWHSWIVDTFIAPNYEGFRTVPVNLAGATVNITSDDKQVQYFTGSGALAGNYAVTFSGTFREGQVFYLKFAATLTLGASTLTAFGENINATTAAGGNYTILAWYDLANTTFRTQLISVPPSSAGWSAPTDLAVPVIGINYPAATAGDTFRIVCAGEEGRLGAIGTVLPYPEEPNCRRVYDGQTLYCLTTTAGGDQATAGTAFWVPPVSAFVPYDNTRGTGSSNFRINIPGNPSAPNTIGAGTNVGNVQIGSGNTAQTGSIGNMALGNSISFTNAKRNLGVGGGHTFQSGSDDNFAAGLNHTIGGDQMTVLGSTNTSTTSVASLLIGGNNQSISLYGGIVLGSGGQGRLANSLNLGGASGAAALGGAGTMQPIIAPLAGAVSTVIHPALSPITLSTGLSDVNGTLTIANNSTAWAFEMRFFVVQTVVGALHTNTSAVGDWVEFVCTGVALRNGAGTTTLTGVKWLDHRNRWIPSVAPNSIAHRNMSAADGTRADICLVRPEISIDGQTIVVEIFFPGFASVVTNQGAGRTPRYAYYLATTDVPMPVINTGVAADDGLIKNTITTTAAPIATAVFRNPIVDIFDGNDAQGAGYYGGVGIGATATAETTTTGIADIGLLDGGSYDNIVATVTFNFGDATATCNMSANSDHIGDDVGFTAGDYTGCPDGAYPMTFAGGTGTGAAGTATITGGVVTATNITNGGSGYTTGDIVTITIPTALPVTTPSVFTPTLYWSVISVTITAPGTLYRNTSDLSVTFAGAGLAQAVGIGQIVPAEITDAGGETGSITVVTNGKGYGISRPNVAVYDGGGIEYEEGNGGSFRASGMILIEQIKYNV